jgi:hypothetical protein
VCQQTSLGNYCWFYISWGPIEGSFCTLDLLVKFESPYTRNYFLKNSINLRNLNFTYRPKQDQIRGGTPNGLGRGMFRIGGKLHIKK